MYRLYIIIRSIALVLFYLSNFPSHIECNVWIPSLVFSVYVTYLAFFEGTVLFSTKGKKNMTK